MSVFLTDPQAIESESMRLIRSQLKRNWQDEELPVIERLIHTSGDPSLEEAVALRSEAIAAGLAALGRGAPVITDVEMVRAGIAKNSLAQLGGRVECFLHDPAVAEKAKVWGLTRTMTALRLHASSLAGAIVAIGNAPTALLEVLSLAKDPSLRPALIIGMPVGFVGAAEAKELLWQNQEIPCITVRGTRGGSPLAAAAVNALIYQAAARRRRQARTLMFQGTSSNVGKSVLTAAFCRIFYQEGYMTAPFKAQNMALNSFVTAEGGEMGRAQVVQAQAAGREPDVRMNPILLKPTGEANSQVILLGKAQGTFPARDYHGEYQKTAWTAVEACLRQLREENEVLVIEGAGSPAEVNLKANDIVNMRVARALQSPVLLIADIDRGGALASVVGTLELLEPEERALVKGIILNKFRGDIRLLQPALDFLREKTGIPVLGVVPYFSEFSIPEEDSVVLEQETAQPAKQAQQPRQAHQLRQAQQAEEAEQLDIAVIRLPYISNFTDFDALRDEEDVTVRYVADPDSLGSPDLVVIPGSKNTLADLRFLHDSGLAARLRQSWQEDLPIIGICGGYQMLGRVVRDPLHLESDLEVTPGLDILPLETEILQEKHTVQSQGRILSGSLFFEQCRGQAVSGYEIHMGSSQADENQAPLFELEAGGTTYRDGLRAGTAVGTYLHGLFDNDSLRRALLTWLWQRRGRSRPPVRSLSQAAIREQAFNQLADLVRKSVDLAAVRALMGL
ncbi:cobyric acid synthase [Peptococcaceae bacterium CEB3]|nr:cobyric acid synthase [Peptococcaceae bacterium CEB3]